LRRHSRSLSISFCLLWFAVIMNAPAGQAQSVQERWDPQPWIDDLHQIRRTLETKYANLEWLTKERQVSLDGLFDDAQSRIAAAGNDAQARSVFERLLRKIDDGHVRLDWPSTQISPVEKASSPITPSIPDFCHALGYAEKSDSVDVVTGLASYRRLDNDPILPIGLVTIGGIRVGLIRIEVFMPQFTPSLCIDAVQDLKISPATACSDSCQDAIEHAAYSRMTAILEEHLRRLHAEGASALVVDITNNGGGSEWAEAAVRILSRKELVSEPMEFVRGSHWAKHWEGVARELQNAAKSANPEDKRELTKWAAQAIKAKEAAEQNCPLNSGCAWLGRAGFSTGLVGTASATSFLGKSWGPTVFSPAEYSYHDGVWTGPVVVLTDQGTGSAAEEFAAVLQDNHAAFIVGARTVGAGCGHTDGGIPTVLDHTKAVMEVPDCARIRADGTNEISGVIPDYLIPWRADDGPLYKAHLLEKALPTILQRAMRTYRHSSHN
jgi:hypothetical protein